MKKTVHVLGLKRLNINMVILPKFIYRFNIIPVKISAGFSAVVDKMILKFTSKCKGLRIVKNILKKNTTLENLAVPYVKNYEKATVNKAHLVLTYGWTNR